MTTPVELITALIHYYCAEPEQEMERMNLVAPAYEEALVWVRHVFPSDDENGYESEKLNVWIKEILNTPLPEHQWIIPKTEAKAK